ncbi:RNA 3'-terminal phosphate cyclase [Oscillatoria acuminata]|uniref:RNA 3'-terminal phosphate cyclase n=1 Tax=Oscillatoria acuminata PCC 6304 TaxID=56110 RepID=K9TDY3_9CYAN|nr:RNA 3'-terminal phosphate cyclase [Oscillatoria acuminata]AFY80224.1 RNA 3''-phosphate cyclase [Oscillatoria acuminata PCC 6304]
MIHIDGSFGEGGGQVLRTALSLATLTGTPLRLDRIRAGRTKPGLAAQHLTGVRAAATLCNAKVYGDSLGSQFLEFVPQSPPQPGRYRFDVTTAGAVSLVLQTILLPLALTHGESVVTLCGGTHVAFSPSFPYIQQVYLPAIARMGVCAEVTLVKWGWYPRGGGEIQLRVTGGQPLSGLNLQERGQLQQVRGLAAVTELPSHIPQRMANRAENRLREAQMKVQVKTSREKGIAPGAGLFLTAHYSNSTAGFSALGKQGLPSDQVADRACDALLEFHHSGAACDLYLADQLLLPAALANSPTYYHAQAISLHLTTNAGVIEQFGIAKIDINLDQNLVCVFPQ